MLFMENGQFIFRLIEWSDTMQGKRKNMFTRWNSIVEAKTLRKNFNTSLPQKEKLVVVQHKNGFHCDSFFVLLVLTEK